MVKHGTSHAYVRLGCRCDECRGWLRDRNRRARQRRRERAARGEIPVPHGRPYTRADYGCTCHLCRMANNRKSRPDAAYRQFNSDTGERAEAVELAAAQGLRTAARAVGRSANTVRQWCKAAGVRWAPNPRELKPCGTLAAYRRGCRCADCLAANAAYHRMCRNDRLRLVEEHTAEFEHGPSAYTNWGCRCEICTEANKARCREYQTRRQAS
jgi:hypothetical protein